MRLSVSQVAWSVNDDAAALELLRDHGIGDWEAVPARVEGLDLAANPRIGAFQSLLYGAEGLAVFDEATWPKFFALLGQRFRLARSLGFRPLVFGSPAQRRVPEGMNPRSALAMALEFFRTAGKLAEDESCVLLIEPNPAMYGCNFLLTHREAASFVNEVGSPGIGLHWDTGAFIAEEKMDWAFLKENVKAASHVHLSLPFLACNYESRVDFFRDFLETLEQSGYAGLVSIEMKKAEEGLPAIGQAIDFFKGILRGK